MTDRIELYKQIIKNETPEGAQANAINVTLLALGEDGVFVSKGDASIIKHYNTSGECTAIYNVTDVAKHVGKIDKYDEYSLIHDRIIFSPNYYYYVVPKIRHAWIYSAVKFFLYTKAYKNTLKIYVMYDRIFLLYDNTHPPAASCSPLHVCRYSFPTKTQFMCVTNLSKNHYVPATAVPVSHELGTHKHHPQQYPMININPDDPFEDNAEKIRRIYASLPQKVFMWPANYNDVNIITVTEDLDINMQ